MIGGQVGLFPKYGNKPIVLMEGARQPEIWADFLYIILPRELCSKHDRLKGGGNDDDF
jgi:hypothetical protein